MKLYQGRYIIPGLVAFLFVATFPLWFGAASREEPFQSPPNPNGETCIEPKETMRENHMQLLIAWRDEVVREGNRTYTASDGTEWSKSLTNTCMSCHGKADENGKSVGPAAYCGDCHDYVGVHTPVYCWDCHIDPVAVGGEAE